MLAVYPANIKSNLFDSDVVCLVLELGAVIDQHIVDLVILPLLLPTLHSNFTLQQGHIYFQGNRKPDPDQECCLIKIREESNRIEFRIVLFYATTRLQLQRH